MRKLLGFFGLASLLMLIILSSAIHFFKAEPEYPISRISKGWNVTYRNEQYVNTDITHLDRQIGDNFSRGDTITLNLSSPLPDVGCPFPYLFVKTQFSAYEIYLDGEIVFTNYVDTLMNNQFVGIGYNVIPLPSDYAGKKLSIKLFITENNSKANIAAPLFGNFDDIYRYLLVSSLLPVFTGVFLFIFGLIFLLVSLLMYLKSSSVIQQVISSIIAMLLGTWIVIAYDDTFFHFSIPEATLVEYASLYLLLPTMYILIYILHRKYDNRLLIVVGYPSLAFSILFITLHVLNIVHINHFALPYFALCFIGLAVIILYDYNDLKIGPSNSSIKLLMLGITVLVLVEFLYAIFAMFFNVVDYRQIPILIYLLPGASLFFVYCQLLNYFVFMTHSYAQKKEYASLQQIAYEDNLTSLPNRASCDKELLSLDESDLDFCLLSLDLNGLKEVNDNAGHPVGDRLLKNFANTLKNCFFTKGTCYRIGGDEFLVVLKQINNVELDSILFELENKLKVLDKEDPEINHSVSYGYAFRHEAEDNTAHSVAMLADKRMYEFKNKYYSDMMSR